jgi:CubicO group peptidase (beta-lactamase class C family)
MINIVFKAILFCLFVLQLSFTGFAQSDSIAVFIHQTMQQRTIPGLQLAVVRKGKIVKLGNYGLSNIQDSIKVQDQYSL